MPTTPVDRAGALLSISRPPVLPSPKFRRVGIHTITFEACSGLTRVTARWIAQPPKAAFVTRFRPCRLPGKAARQLPDLSTMIWVEPSSTGATRPRGALNAGSMKIAFFIYSMSVGGAERVTESLANYWADRGHDVIIVSMVPLQKNDSALRSSVRQIHVPLSSNRANVIIGLWNNVRRVVAFRKILVKERPAVAIAMMATTNVILAIAGLGLSINQIGSERTNPERLNLGRIWGALRYLAYGWLDCIVAQTDAASDWLRQNTNAERVTVIPNPVQIPLPIKNPTVSVDQILGNEKQKIILCVGRLVEEKRLDIAISVFAKLAPRYRQWVLVILGEGPMRSELEAQAESLEIQHRVYMVGTVGNVADWYRYSQIYLMTSDFEGFPNTLLEAMAHGCAVVAVDCQTGPSEMIENGVNGFLVPQNDFNALSAILERCMEDDTVRKEIASRAISVCERFSLKKIADQWESLF